MHIYRRHNGFTLLEVLVATVILALLLSITYGSFWSLTNRVNATEETAKIYQTARIIMDRLFQDMTCAYLPQKNTQEEPLFFFQFQGSAGRNNLWERFSFTSTSHLALRPEERGLDLCRISYQWEKDSSEDNFMLYRLDEPLFMGEKGPERSPVLLGRGITRFSVMFFDEQNQQVNFWDSTVGKYKDMLPMRAVITFTLKDEEGLEYPFSSGWLLPYSY